MYLLLTAVPIATCEPLNRHELFGSSRIHRVLDLLLGLLTGALVVSMTCEASRSDSSRWG
ncbi:MAG: hypothetical protein KDK91_03285 [Gammaproteobacteria bacterium]|nr:hypothetical protein [Gammaproteobacteria bacterium]